MIGWFGLDYKPLKMLWSVPQGLFCSEKMMSLDLLDLHFVFFYIVFDQYLVQIGFHLSQINEIWICGCELKLPVRAI